jgi:CRISPR-associated protein Csd1
MILQALADYYKRIPTAATEGFQKQEIPFIIVLNRQGDFKAIMDTREDDGKRKRAREFLVPKAVKKSVNIAANLLWGTPAYVVGKPKPDKKKDVEKLLERAKEQQACFLDKIKEVFSDNPADEGIKAVVNFIEKKVYEKHLKHNLLQ